MTFPLLVSSAKRGYQIPRSLRFRGAASAYATYSPASGSGNTKAAFSLWVKRGQLGRVQNLLNVGSTSTDYHSLFFDASDQLSLFHVIGDVTTYGFTLSRKFRDPSAHLHIVVVIDSSQAVASDRLKVWVNGVQETAGPFTYYALNTNIFFFNSGLHSIGRFPTTSYYFDGYVSSVVGVHNQSGKTASDFGQADVSGNWVAKTYTGAYGANGFYLDFSDPTSLTTLMLDRSGNDNNWTANNISLTAGATYDSMIDVPPPSGNNRGNYATLNPIGSGGAGYYDANLALTGNNAIQATGTVAFPNSGKWYFEVDSTGYGTGGYGYVGVNSVPNASGATTYCVYQTDGQKAINATVSAYGAAWGAPTGPANKIGVAVDIDSGTITFYKDNVSQGAISYAAGGFFPFVGKGGVNSGHFTINFGQRPFAYTPPAGFKTLHTGNLPESAISNPKLHFDVLTWLGNGTSKNVTGTQFRPDFSWLKDRSTARNNALYDSVRGATLALSSNLTNAETSAPSELTAFLSDGFSVSNSVGANASGESYVSWNWKAGVSVVVNNAGLIASQVNVNQLAGFSIVTYTGTLTSSGSVTIGHGLGVTPKMTISKSRSVTGADGGNWMVQHASLGTDDFITLNSNGAASDAIVTGGGSLPKPTSTVFYSTWNSGGAISGNNYVAYCFAEITGYSKFGSYVGNGISDGPFVYCGFRPRYVLVKQSDGANPWVVWDTSRGTYNPNQVALQPNTSDVEIAYPYVDALSNGFKVRGSSANAAVNASGATYIFAAFAEAPFKYALAR